MKIEFRQAPITQLSSSALVTYAFERAPGSSGSVELLPREARDLFDELRSSGELSGKAYECTLIHHPPGLAAAKLLVVGAGKLEKLDSAQRRRLSGTAVRYLRSRGVHDVAWVVAGPGREAEWVESVVEGAQLADYDSDPYKTERNGRRRIDRLDLVLSNPPAEEVEAARERGRIVAEAQNFTRDLVNEPSNRMTPTHFSQRAEEMAKRFGLDCQVMGPEEIRALKMAAFWAVAQGSDEPPRLIVLRYAPAGAPETPHVGLVGKGITFDSGGISIKPSENMHEMKTDMAGGAAMLGVMQAIAQLKPQGPRHSDHPGHGEYAQRQSLQARRRHYFHVRQDHRNSEYRRGRAAGSCRRAHLREATRLHGAY